MSERRYKLQINTDAEIEILSLEHDDGTVHSGLAGVPDTFRVPRHWLEEIPPPIPAEPEPGAYLIGSVMCMRISPEPGRSWVYGSGGTWDEERFDWLWRTFGGPDVDIVPLVAANRLADDVLVMAKRWHARIRAQKAGHDLGRHVTEADLLRAVDALSAADRAEAGE